MPYFSGPREWPAIDGVVNLDRTFVGLEEKLKYPADISRSQGRLNHHAVIAKIGRGPVEGIPADLE